LSYPDPKYFDYAASTPPFPEALDIYREFSVQYYGNPSSPHRIGKEANKKLFEIKNAFSEMVNFQDGRLLLCASGTEANNTIIEGHRKQFPKGRLLIAENTHDSIWYAREKYPAFLDVLNITREGKIDPNEFIKSIKHDTSLVCINHVCNELGTIHPVSEIANICTIRGIKLLIDGVQALGHITVNLDEIATTYYSFAAHKFGGPRGVGGVFIRDDHFESLVQGGHQEWKLRPGTENLAGLAASLLALKQCMAFMDSEKDRLNMLKDLFLEDFASGTLINSPRNCVPGFISISLPECSGNEMVTATSLAGYAISTGSACHANHINPSRIVMAMGREEVEAKGTIRISMGRGTTEQSVHGLKNTIMEYLS
jgi:cysteine desulfurase